MAGNEEESKQQNPVVASDSLQAGLDQQPASAIPLQDLTCAAQDVESNTATADMIEDMPKLNSTRGMKPEEERDMPASDTPGTDEVGQVVNDMLHDPSKDATKNSPLEEATPLPPHRPGESNATGNSSCHIYAELKQNIGCSSESLSKDPSKTFHDYGFGLVEVEVHQSPTDPLISQHSNLTVSVEPVFEGLEVFLEDGTNCLVTQQFELPVEVISNLDHLETPAGKTAKNFGMSGRRDSKNATRVKKKYMLRSSPGYKRTLRSSAEEKSKVVDSTDKSGNITAAAESKSTRKKKKRTRNVTSDEYSKIKKNLSYMLHRIGYERSLIDAYSSEGWKGLSLEKLKPEKELQRATSEIVRRKSKIRDLFQRLDSMCAEGKLPQALFDEEGMISSEDIFCAKCGSKDLTLDNDIILCDGACERGFHQFCLIPPLLKEDIPPGDEGWLCPGCDCKVDCLDMLNESQGTKVSLTDSWEKVFPEAVKGGNQDPTSGLSSDDSEDEDFDPARPQRDESNSEESEYATASDNSQPQPKPKPKPKPKDDQYMGLPSDDSEDDDFDPDSSNPDKIKDDSSSSDFTSDSEDLKAVVDDDPHRSNGVPRSSLPKGRRGPKRKSFEGGTKNLAINDELPTPLESDPGESGATPVSVRRHVERLDYKKLHDETYGGSSSDSSDDEEWTDTLSPRKRKRSDEDENMEKEETDSTVTKSRGRRRLQKEETESTRTKSRGKQRLQKEETKSTITKSRGRRKSEGPSTPPAAKPVDGKKQSSSARRLGEDVKKRLYEAFKLNQKPDRATKESLGAELGITWQQVDKWFGNARWSANHPEGRKRNVLGKEVKKDASPLSGSDTKPNEEILLNGGQKVGNSDVNVANPGSSAKEDERVEKLSQEPTNSKGSTLGDGKDEANKAPAGQTSGVRRRRRSVS